MKSWYDGSLSGLFFFFSFPWETAFGVEEIMMSFSQVSIPAKISHATPHAQELSLRERHCQTCLMCHCAQSNTTLSIFWVIFCILHVGVHFIVCLFIPLLPHVYVFLCLKWWLTGGFRCSNSAPQDSHLKDNFSLTKELHCIQTDYYTFQCIETIWNCLLKSTQVYSIQVSLKSNYSLHIWSIISWHLKVPNGSHPLPCLILFRFVCLYG